MDKSIRKFASHEDQREETLRYWRSRPAAERFLAVWEATAAAYAFKGIKYDPTEDLRQLLLAFNAHGVEYLVVGGWAVGFYSDPRSTKDIDLFIRTGERNSEAVFQALAEFGAPLAGLSAADFRDQPTSVFQIGHEPVRADILQSISGVDFETAWHDRKELSIEGVPVFLISARHLIENKLASGRLRDLADVEAIREAEKLDLG